MDEDFLVKPSDHSLRATITEDYQKLLDKYQETFVQLEEGFYLSAFVELIDQVFVDVFEALLKKIHGVVV